MGFDGACDLQRGKCVAALGVQHDIERCRGAGGADRRDDAFEIVEVDEAALGAAEDATPLVHFAVDDGDHARIAEALDASQLIDLFVR